jgi:single-strand DNA-binding protein
MTQGLNKVMLFGNLGSDPELRNTTAGAHVLSFRVATTEVYFDKNQQKQERTEWHQVALFGARAEPLARLLHKGSRVLVEGRLHTSSYDKEGSKRYKTEVIANDLFLAGAAGSREASELSLAAPLAAASVAAASGAVPSRAAVRPRAGLSLVEDDDVPF